MRPDLEQALRELEIIEQKDRSVSSISVTPAPSVLPAGHEPRGFDVVIRHELGCDSKHLRSFDVHALRGDGAWHGFVHEFELLGRHDGGRVFAIPSRRSQAERELHIYIAADPEEAVRMLLVDLDKRPGRPLPPATQST